MQVAERRRGSAGSAEVRALKSDFEQTLDYC